MKKQMKTRERIGQAIRRFISFTQNVPIAFHGLGGHQHMPSQTYVKRRGETTSAVALACASSMAW